MPSTASAAVRIAVPAAPLALLYRPIGNAAIVAALLLLLVGVIGGGFGTTVQVPGFQSEGVEVVGASEAMTRVMVSIAKFTRVFSFLGLPTLSVPGPVTTGGLKASVQIAAAPFAEDVTCSIGEAIGKALSDRA